MKKTYQNPTTKVVKIQTVKMIAGSPTGFNKSLNSTNGGDGTNALGRQSNSLWDDEDDFDE